MWRFLSQCFGIEVGREAAHRLAREVGGNQKIFEGVWTGGVRGRGRGGHGEGETIPRMRRDGADFQGYDESSRKQQCRSLAQKRHLGWLDTLFMLPCTHSASNKPRVGCYRVEEKS